MSYRLFRIYFTFLICWPFILGKQHLFSRFLLLVYNKEIPQDNFYPAFSLHSAWNSIKQCTNIKAWTLEYFSLNENTFTGKLRYQLTTATKIASQDPTLPMCHLQKLRPIPFNHLPSNTLKPETNSPAQHLPHPTALFITKLVIQQPVPHPHHYLPTSKHCFKYQSLPKS